MLTTGRTLVPSDSAASEVVNVLDSSSTCQSIPDYPVAVHQASGGILDNVPVVCGGGSDDHGMQSTCYKLEKNTIKWTLQGTKNLSSVVLTCLVHKEPLVQSRSSHIQTFNITLVI